jgi:hypothetical protein
MIGKISCVKGCEKPVNPCVAGSGGESDRQVHAWMEDEIKRRRQRVTVKDIYRRNSNVSFSPQSIKNG